MSFDYSRFGTRLSLSERFSQIRKEAQKKAVLASPNTEPTPSPLRNVKDFNGTFSRADRPSAELKQASEKNRRLVTEMNQLCYEQSAVLAQLNQTYKPPPQQPARTPATPQAKKLNVKQRLGTNIKNRLGVARTPISQRIGIKRLANGNSQPRRNLNGNLIKTPGNRRIDTPRNLRSNLGNLQRVRNSPQINKTQIFKRKNQIAANNSIPARNQKNNTVNRKPVTTQQLDQDLDSYMRNTKSYLNSDLDAYMTQI